MALGFVVPTKFTVQDEMTGFFSKAASGARTFKVAASAAFRSVAHEGSELGHIIKGVTIGSLLSKGIMALTRGIKNVTAQFVDFDAAVVKSAALFKDLDSKAADFGESMRAIGLASRWVAAKTEFYATDTAGALEKMAMAGLSSGTAINLLRGTTDLATAAGTDLTTAVDIATDALGAFGMAATKVNLQRISDVMAKTASAFNTDLTMMFEAIKYAGPSFTSAGQSIDTLSASIGVLANAGIKGSAAGTALNAVFTQLKTETSRTKLEKLIGTVTDAKGNFIDLFDILGRMETRLSGMGNAQRGEILSDIFGSRGERAANLLLQAGAAQLKEYKSMLENSAGAAAQMADVMRGSIKNQIEVLKSSLTELGFKFIDTFKKQGSEALGKFIVMVQRIDPTNIIKFFSGALSSAMTLLKILWDLSPAILGVYTAFKVFDTVTVMINAANLALKGMGAALTIAAGPIGIIAAALAAAGVAIGVLVAKSKAAALVPTEDKYREAAKKMVAENEAARIEAERQAARDSALSATPRTAAGRERKAAAEQAEAARDTVRAFTMPLVGFDRVFQAEAERIMDARQTEIERLRNQPRRYQIHSQYVNEFGPLSLDEALQVQAKKWSDDDLSNRATLTGSQLSEYLAANPDRITYEEALRRLREEAASDSVGDNDMPDELKEYLKKFEELMEQLNKGVDDLNETPESIPGRVSYASMGKEDFWSLAKAGL